jgi:hypothetical protein
VLWKCHVQLPIMGGVGPGQLSPEGLAMKLTLAIAVCLLAAGSVRAASMSGIILPAGRVKSIRAFERQGATMNKIDNRFHDGAIDAKTGKFEIPKLPDGTYQLLIDCGDVTIEGVDLAIDDEEDGPVFDYVFKTKKLAAERVDLSDFFDPDEEVSVERKQKIVAKLMGVPKLVEKLDSLKKVDRFCDHLRPLAAHGVKDKVFVLVEKARLRSFYAGSGQVIYRVEIWPLNRVGAVWDKPIRGVRVLQRHRFANGAAFLKLGAMFEPKLGGIKILKGKSVAGIQYVIPDKWDDVLGKVPGKSVPVEKKPKAD